MEQGAQEGLASYLSSRFDRPVTIAGLHRPTATGFSADTVIVELAVDDASQGFADRAEQRRSDSPLPSRVVVQAAPAGPALFDSYDLRRTFTVQQTLGGFDVPVAAMHWLCEDPEVIGAPFYVMSFIEGRVPPDRPPYHTDGWLHESTEPERRRIWDAGIDAMAALHRVPVDRFIFLDEGGGGDASRQRLDRWRRFGQDLGADAEPALLAALDRLEASRPHGGELRVHWGDAKLGNMVFDQGRVAAILDWELCGLSVGEEDLAHWLAVDWFLSGGLGGPRLDGLPGAAAAVERYERAADRPTAAVDWWFAFAIVRMGLIFQRAAVQSRRRRGDGGPLRPNVIVPHLPRLLDGAIWADHEGR